jgi:curved DNA-binding protein CbpA
MRIDTEDFYTILQVKPTATADEIHRAYRLLAMQYHPDRNSAPDAAMIMARLNEAYAVLSEPARRRLYDSRHRMSCANDLALPILIAAHQALLRQKWTVLKDDGATLVLEQAPRRIQVWFMETVSNERLRKLARHSVEFTVVLAVQVEKSLNLCLQISVIDLVHSRHWGAPFPDEVYRKLFEPFL